MFTSMQTSDRATSPESIPVSSAPTTDHPSASTCGDHLISRTQSDRLLMPSGVRGVALLSLGSALATAGAAPPCQSGHRLPAGRVRTTRRSNPSGALTTLRTPFPQVGAASVASTCPRLPTRRLVTTPCVPRSGASGLGQVEMPSTMTTAPALKGGATENVRAIDNRTQRVATLPVARAPQRVRPMRSMPTDSRLVSSGRARCGAEGCSVHGHTVARAADAFLRRKGKAVAHTGRFTTPPVEAAEAHCRHLWVIAWKDGQLTTDEDTLMCGCEAVVFETMKADATEEVRNAMSQRRGFESPQFDRRLRELRGKVVRFRQRLPQPDPTPAGPAQMKKAA
jgi:hypothetical protein